MEYYPCEALKIYIKRTHNSTKNALYRQIYLTFNPLMFRIFMIFKKKN